MQYRRRFKQTTSFLSGALENLSGALEKRWADRWQVFDRLPQASQRARERAGKKVASVEFENGRLVRITFKNDNAADDGNNGSTNPWDAVDLK